MEISDLSIGRIMQLSWENNTVIPGFNIPYLPMMEPVVKALHDTQTFGLIMVARLEWIKFKSGSIIRNRDFDTGGPLPGWAAWWTIEDDANLLDNYAGDSRGRCVPQNYDSGGEYVMVLGDDRGRDSPMAVGDVFAVSQEIDLTNINTLTVDLKFIKR